MTTLEQLAATVAALQSQVTDMQIQIDLLIVQVNNHTTDLSEVSSDLVLCEERYETHKHVLTQVLTCCAENVCFEECRQMMENQN